MSAGITQKTKKSLKIFESKMDLRKCRVRHDRIRKEGFQRVLGGSEGFIGPGSYRVDAAGRVILWRTAKDGFCLAFGSSNWYRAPST